MPPHPDPLPASGERENSVQLPRPPLTEDFGAAAPTASDPASIVPHLQSAVARVLPAIEATIDKLAAGPQAPRPLEQTARALGALTRTLRELNALLAQQPPPRPLRQTTTSLRTSTRCAKSWRSGSRPS